MITHLILFLFLLALNLPNTFSQGCSDAGACSAGSLGLKDDDLDRTKLMLGYSQSIGLADKESIVLGSELRVNHEIFPTSNLEIRVPYLVTIGNLGATSGVGDLLITFSQQVINGEKSIFTLVAGGRLKTNDTNKKLDGEALPMVYQSSLGTYDIIAGMAWQSQRWSVSIAYQHPFGSNLNEYLHPFDVELPDNKLYYESAFLKRGDDLMLRIQRTIEFNEASKIHFGFLPIYRIQEDQIKRDGVYEKLPGSSGITYNVFFNWMKELKPGKLLNLSVGIPLHARDYRADGLTRTVIVGAGLILKFNKSEGDTNAVDDLYNELKFED
ncbi:MAG: hypothetical protein KQI35_02265 [Bacteroidetes bacterium]|nr:hypothetical protein [Bacteroidota bacterium]